MKKKALVTIAMCLLLFPFTAQGHNNFGEGRNNIFVGIAGDLHLLDIDFDAMSFTGVFLEMMLSRSIGIETGFFNKKFSEVEGSLASIPVGIKYYSNLLNITGGVTLNLDVGYERENNFNRTLEIGTYLRLSRDFALNDRVIFEPGLSYHLHFYSLIDLGYLAIQTKVVI